MCEGRAVDVMVVMVCWSIMCEDRAVEVLVVMVCWS